MISFDARHRDGANPAHTTDSVAPAALDTHRSRGRRPVLQAAAGLLLAGLLPTAGFAQGQPLLNASYDVSREFYKDYNAAFIRHWKDSSGETLAVNQSHGGSSKQARAIIDGLEADVVTMNQASDIDAIAQRSSLVPGDWAKLFPDNASPTASISVILVRKGNPQKIREWSDLARDGVSVVIPNPKVSGNGRYTYLAAWGAAQKAGQTPEQIRAQLTKIFANVPVFDGGGRAATTTFAQRQIGDALATFESEVNLIRAEFGDFFEVVYPGWTVLAENPVAVVEGVAKKKKTERQARAYLEYLWSDEAQEIAARHQLRPRSAKVLASHAADFPKVQTFTVDEAFGGWSQAQKDHFNEGATYDQILAVGKR